MIQTEITFEKYVPELKNIPSKYIHLPAELDNKSLIEYGVKLGSDYPEPIVDLSATRQRALNAFQKSSEINLVWRRRDSNPR